MIKDTSLFTKHTQTNVLSFGVKVFNHKMSPLNLNFGRERATFLRFLTHFTHFKICALHVQSRLWLQTPQAPVPKISNLMQTYADRDDENFCKLTKIYANL